MGAHVWGVLLLGAVGAFSSDDGAAEVAAQGQAGAAGPGGQRRTGRKGLCHLAAASSSHQGQAISWEPSQGQSSGQGLCAGSSCLPRLAWHGDSTQKSSVFFSPRLTHAQAAWGTTRQGDSSDENESEFNTALLCKVLWDARTGLLCTTAGGDGAGRPAPQRGLQAALLWA